LSPLEKAEVGKGWKMKYSFKSSLFDGRVYSNPLDTVKQLEDKKDAFTML